MIFDSHTHVDVVEKWGWIDPPEAILELMDEAQVEKAVVMTYRDSVKPDDPATLYVKEAVDKYPDRLVAYIRVNPNSPQAMDAFDQAMVNFRFMGLKLHTVSHVGFPYAEPALRMLRRAAQYHAPVLFHTGDESLALPEEVAEAARLAPEATVIMAHLGGYYHNYGLIKNIASLPNVMVDTSACPYPWIIRQAVDAFGPERVLYASDGPGCPPILDVAKVKLAGLTPEEEELVFSGNILRLLSEVRHAL